MHKNNNDFKTIGIVLSNFPPYSETFFRNKIDVLNISGFNVILFLGYKPPVKNDLPCRVKIAPKFSGTIFNIGINIAYNVCKLLISTPKRSFKLYKLQRKNGISRIKSLKITLFNQYILEEELDWLHFGYGMLAVNNEFVAEVIDAKMAVSFRGFDIYLSPIKNKNCYLTLFQTETFYHVLSKSMKNRLIKCGIKPMKIKVIPPAIDINLFSGKVNSSVAQPISILTVARLHWIKGIEYILDSLAILKNSGIEFIYRIVGEGSEYERLAYAVHQLNLSDNVIFIGVVEHKKLYSLYHESQIYIQYSIQEGFCNAVLEAQSMGLLCIVSDAEGLQENVLDNETGWVVPRRKPKILAKTIIEVISHPQDIRERISKNAIDRVAKTFNLDLQKESFIEFYNQ